MKSFSLNSDNDITVHATLKAAREAGNGSGEEGAGVFDSEAGLDQLIGADGNRLVPIWNSLTGVTPAKKFRDRATTVKRIFAELQKLSAPEAPLLKQRRISRHSGWCFTSATTSRLSASRGRQARRTAGLSRSCESSQRRVA